MADAATYSSGFGSEDVSGELLPELLAWSSIAGAFPFGHKASG
jgi:hypothetical protein